MSRKNKIQIKIVVVFRMNGYAKDKTYDDHHKVIDYTPTFNTSSKLEFNILVCSKY